MVRDADIVKRVLTFNARFPKKIMNIAVNIVGKGLVTFEGGEDWKRHRRIIQPSFQTRFIKESLDSIVPEYAERLVSYWKRSEGREIDISVHLSNCTLDVLGLVAFAHDFRAMDSIKQWSEDKGGNRKDQIVPVSDNLIQALNSQVRSSPFRLLLGILNLSWLDMKATRSKKAINNAVDDIIENARSKAGRSAQGDATNKVVPNSLLEALFDAKDTDPANQTRRKRLDNVELRDELKTFVVAGHETTSSWCTWCSFVLCKYPDVQQKVYADIMKHAPSPNDHSFPISLELVNQMPYFNAFMKEVLILYPPVGIIFRNPAGEEIINGLKITADTRIAVPISLIHRHPDRLLDGSR
jgi:cytochrome P450